VRLSTKECAADLLWEFMNAVRWWNHLDCKGIDFGIA